MMSSTALLAELISDGHATVGTRNFDLKTTKIQKMIINNSMYLNVLEYIQRTKSCFSNYQSYWFRLTVK